MCVAATAPAAGPDSTMNNGPFDRRVGRVNAAAALHHQQVAADPAVLEAAADIRQIAPDERVR